MECKEICLLIQDMIKRIVNDNSISIESKNIISDIFDTIELLGCQETDTYMIFISSLIHLVDLLYDRTDRDFNHKIDMVKIKVIGYIYNRVGFSQRVNNQEPLFSQVFTGAFSI